MAFLEADKGEAEHGVCKAFPYQSECTLNVFVGRQERCRHEGEVIGGDGLHGDAQIRHIVPSRWGDDLLLEDIEEVFVLLDFLRSEVGNQGRYDSGMTGRAGRMVNLPKLVVDGL